MIAAGLVLVCLAAVGGCGAEAEGLRMVYRAVDKCSDDPDVYSCLKLKAVSLLDRALSLDSLPISDYVSINKDPKVKDAPVPLKTEGELEASLPRDLDKKSSSLDTMLQERVSRYLDSRTLQFSIPADALEAGRKKKDKGGMMMMAAVAMGGMMLQMAMGKIALLAGKALLIGKIALLLSAVIGLKKLVGGGGGESHPQVVYAAGGGGEHHGGGWGRSAEEEAAAHAIVYKAYKPL